MRWIVRLLALVVVLVLLVVGALFLIPTERIAGIASQQFMSATGRALTISGSVRPTLWPNLGVQVEGVGIANADWSDDDAMITAERVNVGVDLAALWGGAITIRSFELSGARIILERSADGRANWEIGTAGGETAASGSPSEPGALPLVSVDRAEIRDLSLSYIDRQAGTRFDVDDVTIVIRMPDAQGPVDVTLSADTAAGAVNAALELGSLRALLEGAVTPVGLRLTGEGTDFGFTGRAGLDPVAAEGRVEGSIARLAPLLALAGQSGSEPLPEGARPLALAGQVTLAPAGSLHLREGRIGIGANRIAAELDVLLDGDRPRLTGGLSADSLDLRPFLGGGGESAAGGGSGWPTTPIDASALGALDAQLGISTGPIQTGFADIDAFSGTLSIDRSRAVLTIGELRGFDGRISGELVANNRSGLSVGGNLAMGGVQLLPLLRQAAGFERLTGIADAQLQFLGSGQSVDAIMRSLSGSGRLGFGSGEIIGLDLAGMLRNLDASYVGEGNRTIYESIGATFAIQNGVLRNEDLALAAEYLSVAGLGSVDLGGQTLDYRVTPAARRDAQSEAALSVPLLITGPWSAPRFRLDLEGLAEQRLGEERARLEAAARAEAERLEAEARARLEGQLGIQRQEGQSTEDAVRQSVEDRAREELLRLLGGGRTETPPPAGN